LSEPSVDKENFKVKVLLRQKVTYRAFREYFQVTEVYKALMIRLRTCLLHYA